MTDDDVHRAVAIDVRNGQRIGRDRAIADLYYRRECCTWLTKVQRRPPSFIDCDQVQQLVTVEVRRLDNSKPGVRRTKGNSTRVVQRPAFLETIDVALTAITMRNNEIHLAIVIE